LHWTEVTASNLLEVTYDGRIAKGSGIADQTAVCIHGPIHRLVPDAECVMHTHMPYCTALSQLEDMTLEMTGQSAVYFMTRLLTITITTDLRMICPRASVSLVSWAANPF